MATTTYSFRDVNGAIVPSSAAPFILQGGNLGVGQFVVSNDAEHTTHDVASDAAVMVSFIDNDTGALTIECQQTSLLDQYLVTTFNILKTLAQNGDSTAWAGTTIMMRNPQHTHTLKGVSFTKIPDRTYTAQGSKLTWKLMAAQVTTL